MSIFHHWCAISPHSRAPSSISASAARPSEVSAERHAAGIDAAWLARGADRAAGSGGMAHALPAHAQQSGERRHNSLPAMMIEHEAPRVGADDGGSVRFGQ